MRSRTFRDAARVGVRSASPGSRACSVRGPSEDRREHRKDSSLVMRSSSQNRQDRTADGRCQEPGGARVRASPAAASTGTTSSWPRRPMRWSLRANTLADTSAWPFANRCLVAPLRPNVPFLHNLDSSASEVGPSVRVEVRHSHRTLHLTDGTIIRRRRQDRCRPPQQ